MKLNIHISRAPSRRQHSATKHLKADASSTRKLKQLMRKFRSQQAVNLKHDDKCEKACVSISTIESVPSSDCSISEYDDQQPPSYIECLDDKKSAHIDTERGRSREVTALPTYRPLAPSLTPPARNKQPHPQTVPNPPKFKYISQRNEYNQRIKTAATLTPDYSPPVSANKNQIIIQLPHSHIINPRTIHHITQEVHQLDLLNADIRNWFRLLEMIILVCLVCISLSSYYC